MKNLTEKKISSEVVFKGRFLDVRRDIVTLPNNANSTNVKHIGVLAF